MSDPKGATTKTCQKKSWKPSPKGQQKGHLTMFIPQSDDPLSQRGYMAGWRFGHWLPTSGSAGFAGQSGMPETFRICCGSLMPWTRPSHARTRGTTSLLGSTRGRGGVSPGLPWISPTSLQHLRPSTARLRRGTRPGRSLPDQMPQLEDTPYRRLGADRATDANAGYTNNKLQRSGGTAGRAWRRAGAMLSGG